jgi:hypothetical protein
MKIIATCGLIGSGKDTVADYLCNFHQYKRDSFASTLKDAVSCVFGWDRELLEGRTKHSRNWREQIDDWWSARLDIPNLTPRWVLQNWGTEVCRHGFHDDIWIASLENRLRNTKDNVVITDCRFQNEVKALKSIGALIIRIKRGPDPDWFHTASSAPELMPTQYPVIHSSEYSWIQTDFDDVIDNNGTIEELYNKIKNLA